MAHSAGKAMLYNEGGHGNRDLGEAPAGSGAGPQNPDPDAPKPGSASRTGPENPGLGGSQQGR